MNLFLKKSLGQHFLLDPTLIEKILRLAHLGAKDQVLEIGPGAGVMTEKIAEKAARLVAVEKDQRLVPLLKEKLSRFSHLQVIEGDFLELDLEKILTTSGGGKWKVIANLPYNIATEAVFRFLRASLHFSSLYLMVQKEVADRLTAGPGSKDYGILSIMTQIFSQNRTLLRLPPGAFTPPPKVHSALVEFQVAEAPRYPIHHLTTFESVIQAAFAQRRKMILNSLRGALGVGWRGAPLVDWEGLLRQAEIPATTRAEQVPIEKFVALANLLAPR